MIDLDVKNEIRRFVVDVFGYGDESLISDETSLLESGLIDSTDILELIVFLESRFEITVEDDDVVPENFDSVSRLNDYTSRKLDR